MPKLYSFFLAICFIVSTSLTAQYQSVLGSNNTSWKMKQWLITVNTTQCIIDSTWVDHSPDTTFQNNTFKPILGITSLDRNARVRGYVAEDTTTGKLLFRDNSIDSNIYQVMDMSLSLNDTFMVDQGILGTTLSIVDSVYTLSGKKVIRLDYQEPIQTSKGVKMYHYTMIEGVGINLKGVNYSLASNSILDTNWRDGSLNYAAPIDSFLICDLSTKLSELQSRENIRVYPNPATQTLTIEGSSAKLFQVYGIDGKLMKSGRVSQNIDVSELPEGLYFLLLDQQYRVKFVIDR